jgi:hypothetical protein
MKTKDDGILSDPIELSALTDGVTSTDGGDTTETASPFIVNDTVRQIHSWFRASRQARAKWRSNASSWYKFYNGDQYTEEDKQKYQNYKRPMPVFNRIAPIVRTVVGLAHEDNTMVVYKAVNYESPSPQQQQQQQPPETPVQQLNQSELIQSVCNYFDRRCGATDEDLEAFRDLIICGEGWSESFVSINFEGKVDPKRVRVNPFEMFPDRRAERKNYSDARYVIRARNYRKADLIALYPHKRKEILSSLNNIDSFGDSISASYDISNSDMAARAGYFELDRMVYDGTDQVTVLECQWYDYEHVLHVTLPDKTVKTMSDRSYKLFRKELAKQGVKDIGDPQSIRQKVYKRAFIMGNLELSSRTSPLPDEFTYKCMTGERDQSNGYYYGVIQDLMDPQRYANIYLGTVLHIINTNAKGGIAAEPNAFDDISQAEDSWAESDSITWLAEGGASKIIPKPTTPMPASLTDMLSFAVSSMPQISGVSLDMQGLNTNPQAMVLEQERRKVGKKLLAPFFSSLTRYRHDCGVAFWKLIKSYVDPARLILIGDLEAQQVTDLSILDEDFEVNVEVTEGYDNNKNVESMWDSLSKILPGMMQSGIPIPPSIVQLIPAPDKLRKEWAELIAKSSEPKPPTPVEQSLAKESEASAKESDSKTQLNIAKASLTMAETALKEKEILMPLTPTQP